MKGAHCARHHHRSHSSLAPKNTRARRRKAPAELRLLVCSDLRVQSIPELVAWVRAQVEMPDLIVYGGDDVARFRPEPGLNYWSELAACAKYGLVAVHGNDDRPLSTTSILGSGVTDLWRKPLLIGGFSFLGVEGAETTPSEPGIGPRLLSPRAIARALAKQLRAAPARTHVLVSHSPPREVLDRAMRFSLGGDLRSIGSYAVRQFVERSPTVRLVCCGHCHLQGGQHTLFGRALVVNAASHDDRGARARVALIRLTHEGVDHIEWQELQLAHGFEGLPAFGSRRAASFRAAGIPHTSALATADPYQVAAVLRYSPRAAVPFMAAAHAITHNEPVVHGPLNLPLGPHVYLDIETDLRQYAVWMVGLLDSESGRFEQFVARRRCDERLMLAALTSSLARSGRPVITWSGSRFDERVLHQAYLRHGLAPPKELIAAADALLVARNSVALPLRDWKLGTVALWCDFKFRHPELDGFLIGQLCGDYRRSGKLPPAGVLRYNEDDVRALAAVVGRLEALSARGLTTPQSWRGLPGPRWRRKGSRRRTV